MEEALQAFLLPETQPDPGGRGPSHGAAPGSSRESVPGDGAGTVPGFLRDAAAGAGRG